jgi:hypothetical protein
LNNDYRILVNGEKFIEGGSPGEEFFCPVIQSIGRNKATWSGIASATASYNNRTAAITTPQRSTESKSDPPIWNPRHERRIEFQGQVGYDRTSRGAGPSLGSVEYDLGEGRTRHDGQPERPGRNPIWVTGERRPRPARADSFWRDRGCKSLSPVR